MTVAAPLAGHVLVVGAGGIGCPAAWGLAAAGIARITLIDNDLVERSNLPRQVLYTADDIGKPKAPTAAARLKERCGVAVTGLAARFDHYSAAALLADVDVVIDATDGATTKDWLNQLAVRHPVALVHAAGLRGEARLLCVPPKGAPCLACLFGRLTQETGSCADLGVWNGVVGTIGFLAAQHAIDRLRSGSFAAPAYEVFDLQGAHHMALGANRDPACPVCSETGQPTEPYPEAVACEVPAADESALGTIPVDVAAALDLRTTRCPLNLLQTREALETLAPGQVLDVRLGDEGAQTVPAGIAAMGHRSVARRGEGTGLRLWIEVVSPGGTSRLATMTDAATLERFARQIVLPGVGVAGQARLQAASVRVVGSGVPQAVAATYLAAAGIEAVACESAAVGDTPGGTSRSSQLHVEVGAAVASLETHAHGVRATWGSPGEIFDVGSVPLSYRMALACILADHVQRGIVAAPFEGVSLTLPLPGTTGG